MRKYHKGDAPTRKGKGLSGITVALSGATSEFPTFLVHKICHAVSGQCMAIDEPERGPCTVENCSAMKAAYDTSDGE